MALQGEPAIVIPPIDREQTDYDKIRRIPYLYVFNIFTSVALLCTTSAPLALYAAELHVPKDRIGVLGGILPFAQILCIAFLPLVMKYGYRIVATTGYMVRYFFLLLFFVAPLVQGAAVFWVLFVAMVGFAASRTAAETAVYPWSQDYMPGHMRGRITGNIALIYLPVALISSFLVQLWLDGHSGIERFFPIFSIGIGLGIAASCCLLGIGGGRPSATAPRGLASIRPIKVAMRDGNFLLYLCSSGTQYFVYTVIGLFTLLFFRERLGISSGQLVLMSSLIPVGAAMGTLVAGWFVDRYGTRAIRVTLQSLQVVLLVALIFVNRDLPGVDVLAGCFFFLFGLLFQSSISVGSIYMLNYVPRAQKENYMSLAYTSDGIIGGGATFLAGMLVQFLQVQPVTMLGIRLGNYETLFALSAVITVLSAITFAMLHEEGATGVRDFLGQFRQGSPLKALWSIHRYGALTSEERRRELTYGFGGTRSGLVKEELIAALSDPSFDVRHEAIQSLGHLPNTPAVVGALEGMLHYDGLVELQYAALSSLGRLRAIGSGEKIARFLDDANPLLRARAVRTLGDIRDGRYLPRIREILSGDAEIDCRLAAVSALGKLKDRDSVDGLLAIYRELAGDGISMAGEPRSKVVLLALSKILGCEESFSREWRREEKVLGYRLPNLVGRLSNALKRLSTEESAQHFRLLTQVASELGAGSTTEAFKALQSLRPYVAGSRHKDAPMILTIMDGTRDIVQSHRALLILLCLVIRPALQR